MKKVASILVSLAALAHCHAQWLRPEPIEGAVWGGLIGGIVGGDRCHGFSGRGAAIGAGVGLLAGSLLSESRRGEYYGGTDYVYIAPPSVNVSLGYGYRSCGSSAYVSYTPNRYCAPGTYYRPTRPNYVVSDTVLGAATSSTTAPAHITNTAQPTTSEITSHPSATSTYTWTPRPQIADAPSIPNAPTF